MSVNISREDFVQSCIDILCPEILDEMDTEDIGNSEIQDIGIEEDAIIDFLLSDEFPYPQFVREDAVYDYVRPFRKLYEIYDNVIT